ncbi:MAG: hypothetical protein ACK5KP_09865 [Paludibacteraceae bacterium]
MKKKNILLLIPLFSSLPGFGQITNVTFLNTGEMNVAPGVSSNVRKSIFSTLSASATITTTDAPNNAGSSNKN